MNSKHPPSVEYVWRFFQKLKHNCDTETLFRFTRIHTLPSHNTQKYAQITQQHRFWSQKYLSKARRILPLLRFLPGVRAIAVCNSVALGTAEKTSDIDLLIITASDRIWAARIFCTAILHLLGVRRHGNKVSGRFCLSFFVTEDDIDFENIALRPHDPYLAFWVASLVPIFGSDIFEKIAQENTDFVWKHANIYLSFGGGESPTKEKKSYIQCFLEFMTGKWGEVFLKKIFLPRSLKKASKLVDASGTRITETMLKFHNTERRGEFLEVIQ